MSSSSKDGALTAPFASSTHARWIFTREQIDEKRRVMNDKAVNNLRARDRQRRKRKPDSDPESNPPAAKKAANDAAKVASSASSSNYASLSMDLGDEKSSSSPLVSQSEDAKSGSSSSSKDATTPLTVEEEVLLRAAFERQIWDLCDALRFPNHVRASAVAYFKRFYLNNSLMEYRPELMLVCCVFLATKTEENYTSIDRIASLVDKQPKQIVKLEVPLLTGIKFHLRVHHPYLPLTGLFNGMKAKGLRVSHELFPVTEEFICDCYLSDAFLMYPPSQIALGALRFAGRQLNDSMVDAFIHAEFGQQQNADAVLDKTSELIQLVETKRARPAQSRKELKRLTKRLKKCGNPLFDRESAEYKAAKKAERERLNRRRQRKYTDVEDKKADALKNLMAPTDEDSKEFSIKTVDMSKGGELRRRLFDAE